MKRSTIAVSALVVALAIPSLAAAQPQLTLDWPALADGPVDRPLIDD